MTMPDKVAYILNSAVVTDYGLWEYLPLTLEEVTTLLKAGGWLSCVGYEETAHALTLLTGVEVGVNRVTSAMQVGDSAVVFRLNYPKGFRRPSRSVKGGLPIELLMDYAQIGLLHRLA